MTAPLELTDLDRRIWQDELDEFVPRHVFDVHTHIYRWAFNLDPGKNSGALGKLLLPHWAEATWDLANTCDAQLMPGREVHRLAFPFPWPYPCDFAGSNAYLAQELKHDRRSAGLLLVHPGTTADEADAELDRFGFLGFKPYRFYASTGDAVNCRMTEFMPEHLIQVADRRGLIIMMHISKRDAIADADNLTDLVRLCDQHPNVRWILAHCARSYSAWAIEKAAATLRRLPNVWYDVSSVCESDAIDALFTGVGADRVMYGSDDIPVGVLRGKYIAFGRAWAFLSEGNHSLNLSHCDSRMTFTRYEQLRAMRRAARRLGMSAQQNQALFHDTAMKLIASVGKSGPIA
jgi:glutamate-1-semialdehyde 2,1-aminomutase